jgi:hypothetical protein
MVRSRPCHQPAEQNIMTQGSPLNPGIERLIAAYVNAFRIPENLNHYAPDDFEKAQRQFVRFCLRQGHVFQVRDGSHETRS